MKAVNVIVLMLMVLYLGPAFREPEFWRDGRGVLMVIGILGIPGTHLLASYLGRLPTAPEAPRILAACYNGGAMLILVWKAVAMMNAAEIHPVAIGITQMIGCVVMAFLAMLNVLSLVMMIRPRSAAASRDLRGPQEE